MKIYVLKDLNDPTKNKIESRSKASGTICEAPKDENGNYVTDVDIIVVNDIIETWLQSKQSVDVNGDPVFETLQRPTYSFPDGLPILDANENPVMEDYQSPVYDLDANGDVITEEVPTGDTHKEASVDPALKTLKDSKVLQRKKDSKLERIRSLRKLRLNEVDVMINDLTLGDRADTAAIQSYRNQLRDITDSYKDGNGTATDAIDALADDLSDLTWPTKP